MLKILKKSIFIFLLLIAIFGTAHFVLAAPLDVGLEYPAKIGLGDQDIRITIAKIIRVALGFLGIIAVGLIMYAGWLWMSSEGNEEKIEQAKKILKNAIIGLIIILSAFAIATFIINKLMGATSGGPGGGPGGGIASLGASIIDSHYPARNQKDVPRNTKMAITFKEPMDAATIITDGKINSKNILIYKTIDGASGPFLAEVAAFKTDDDKIFVFKPKEYLGSPSEKIWYSVALTKDIRKANGDAAFPGLAASIVYDWSFEVGTFIDVTPPKMEGIIPFPNATEPRNVVVQANFSEAVDPIAASGATKNGFSNIVITDKIVNTSVSGNFYISNQYKTVEFLTEDACGTNSCGNTIYCLPGNKSISPLVKAATVTESGFASFPYDGVVDMADNSFDGNGDGKAAGGQKQSGLPPFNADNIAHEGEGDDYVWSFKTTDKIDISAATIESISPSIKEMGVSLDTVPETTFSKFLMSSSLTTDSIGMFSNPVVSLNYWISKFNNEIGKKTTIYINHDQFNENTDYSPRFTGAIKDIYQNCYNPCSGLGVTGAPSCCDGVPTKGECK